MSSISLLMELVLDFSGERWRYDVDITARVRGRIDRELQDGGCRKGRRVNDPCAILTVRCTARAAGAFLPYEDSSLASQLSCVFG